MFGLRRHLCIVAVAAALSFPLPAQAFNEQAALQCVLKQALAILTCKTPNDFSFMGVREGVFVYNVHFGAEYTEFYAQIFGEHVIFSSRAWTGRMASGEISRDNQNGCLAITTNTMPCSSQKQAKCCAN